MCFAAFTAALKSGSVHGPLAVWPSLHNAYAHFLDSWHRAEVGGSPRLKLLPHRMHVSFRNDSRGAMEASVRIETKKYRFPAYFFVVSAPSTWPRRPLGIIFTPDAPGASWTVAATLPHVIIGEILNASAEATSAALV